MDRTRMGLGAFEAEITSYPTKAAAAFGMLAALGVSCDAESFRAQAEELGEPYKIADAWRRQSAQIIDPDPFNALAIMAWMDLIPGRPCGDVAVVELASLVWSEEEYNEEEFLREAVSRTLALGRLAYDLRPGAPGEWLRELMDACPGFDVLEWVVAFLVRLHRLRRRSSVMAICRAWMPLLRDLWAGQPLLPDFPCLCLSGSPLVSCCGRWGRG